jgi:hypothetical protein
MKTFGINGQWRNKKFLIVIHRFSLVKTFRDILFNDDLSNEPNFGRLIHLAGQYV